MGSSATGVRGWRPRRCRSRRATQQPEAQVSDSRRQAVLLHTAVHRGLPRGCRVATPGPAGLSEQGPGVPGPLAALAFA